ncbi:MAG: hypothetical protein ACOCV2_15670 [Persicimonas sp.]
MDVIRADRVDDTLQVAATFPGRGLAALERFLFLFLVLVVFGAIFFAPDYVMRYREEEPVPGLLLGALAGVAALISLATALVRFVHSEVWAIDLDEKMLVYQSKRVLRGFEQTGVDIDRVDHFRLVSRRAPRSSGLYVELTDGNSERMCELRAGRASFEEAADDMEAFLDEHDLDIEVRREVA